MEATTERLREVFAATLGVPLSEIDDDTAYDRSKGWDSIAHLALIAALESAFDVMLDTEDVIEMSSFPKSKEILKKYGVTV